MDNFPIFNDFPPAFPQEPFNWTKFFFSIKKKWVDVSQDGWQYFQEPVIIYSGPYTVI